MYKKLIKAKQMNYFSKIQKVLLQKYDEQDSVQDKQMFMNRVILWCGMVWYGMVCYPVLWYGMESMEYYEISMLCYEISMLWFML